MTSQYRLSDYQLKLFPLYRDPHSRVVCGPLDQVPDNIDLDSMIQALDALPHPGYSRIALAPSLTHEELLFSSSPSAMQFCFSLWPQFPETIYDVFEASPRPQVQNYYTRGAPSGLSTRYPQFLWGPYRGDLDFEHERELEWRPTLDGFQLYGLFAIPDWVCPLEIPDGYPAPMRVSSFNGRSLWTKSATYLSAVTYRELQGHWKRSGWLAPLEKNNCVFEPPFLLTF